MWKWIAASRANKVVAAACAALSVLVVISSVSAYRFHSQAQAAKKAEKLQAERADKLQQEGESERKAWQDRIGATDPRLAAAIREVRTLTARLERIEAERRELWIPPAVDNLAARFDRAVEGLR
jgi:hypothetical protein